MAYRERFASILVVAFSGRVFGLKPESAERLWEYDLGAGPHRVRLESIDGRVFAGVDKKLACLDEASGQLLWQIELPIPVNTLLVKDDRVYVGTGGQVCCCGTDGHLLWHERFPRKGWGRVALALRGHVVQADDDTG